MLQFGQRLFTGLYLKSIPVLIFVTSTNPYVSL